MLMLTMKFASLVSVDSYLEAITQPSVRRSWSGRYERTRHRSWESDRSAPLSLLRDAEKYLYPVNMGATAIGTGINVPTGYPENARRILPNWQASPSHQHQTWSPQPGISRALWFIPRHWRVGP